MLLSTAHLSAQVGQASLATGYDAQAWQALFALTGGAAAALAGLIFVAVSVNHQAILQVRALSALTARTLSLLVGVVVLSIFGLVPGQPSTVLGLEVLATGVIVMAIVVGTTARHLASSERRSWRVSLLAAAAVASLPTVVAGISLLVGSSGGLYWLLVGFVTAISVAAYYGWILLIEIRR